VDGPCAEGIAHFGAIDCDPRDAIQSAWRQRMRVASATAARDLGAIR
jgi:hypothetical protein